MAEYIVDICSDVRAFCAMTAHRIRLRVPVRPVDLWYAIRWPRTRTRR